MKTFMFLSILFLSLSVLSQFSDSSSPTDDPNLDSNDGKYGAAVPHNTDTYPPYSEKSCPVCWALHHGQPLDDNLTSPAYNKDSNSNDPASSGNTQKGVGEGSSSGD